MRAGHCRYLGEFAPRYHALEARYAMSREEIFAESADTPAYTGATVVLHNRLLGNMSDADLAALVPYLERVELKVGEVLAKGRDLLTHVYFPEGCVISIVAYMADGTGVEVGTIGDEGMAGLPAYFDGDASEGETLVQIPGSAMRIRVSHLLQEAGASPSLRRLLNRFALAYMTQLAQNGACNRLHSIEQRCARWLLMTHDRMGQPKVMPLKQQFLAFMLGVRRAGVSVAAGALQDAGFIRYRRGSIRVLDRPGLQTASCECYEVIHGTFERMLARVRE